MRPSKVVESRITLKILCLLLGCGEKEREGEGVILLQMQLRVEGILSTPIIRKTFYSEREGGNSMALGVGERKLCDRKKRKMER